jgi:hypothetical protein
MFAILATQKAERTYGVKAMSSNPSITKKKKKKALDNEIKRNKLRKAKYCLLPPFHNPSAIHLNQITFIQYFHYADNVAHSVGKSRK